MSVENNHHANERQTPRIQPGLASGRLNNFIDKFNTYRGINLTAMLDSTRLRFNEDWGKLEVYSVPDLKRISFEEATKHNAHNYRKARVGEYFGPSWATHWFHLHITLPDSLANQEVHLEWDSSSEALLWSTSGQPLIGLHGTNSLPRHTYILTNDAKPGEKYSFYIEAACNDYFGNGGQNWIPDPNRYYQLAKIDLVVPNHTAHKLFHDFVIIKEIAQNTPTDWPRQPEALYCANEIVNVIRRGDQESLHRARVLARNFLEKRNGDSAHRITAVGHCHIDTAWLWPYAETRRKTARSWVSQIRIMEKFPHYKFVCSQVQQWDWLLTDYPGLFDEIKKFVAKGQFIPIGGTWTECDANIPNGESFARQFLLGQSFYKKHFGKHTSIFWLPDTFGYSAQLPQISSLSGAPYFLTQKLSWNSINRFPLTTFYWAALDGTKVLTHMPPSNTYNADVRPHELLQSMRNHNDRLYTNESLLVFGHGDGGGGPTYDMLERLERMEDLDGLPTCTSDDPVKFFKRVEERSNPLSSWKGELYFELHRGTYTTQASTKRYNRKCELLLRDVEFLSTLAMLKNRKRKVDTRSHNAWKYPQTEIDRLWKIICLNQFHDVGAGSEIEMAVHDALRLFKDVQKSGTRLRIEAIKEILGIPYAVSQASSATSLVLINTLPWSRTGIIEIPLDSENGFSISDVEQVSTDGKLGYITARDIIGMGVVPTKCTDVELDEKDEFVVVNQCAKLQSQKRGHVNVYQTSDETVLENQFIRATFSKKGELTSLFDVEIDRELVPEGARGNVFQLYDDMPNYWDAWDVEIHHLEKYDIVDSGTVKIIEEGPLRVSISIAKTLSDNSNLKQIVSLNCFNRRLEFDTQVDWHENRRFLKVEFTWDIVSDFATYESAFGHVQRPTHYNTSWDYARFEVCGHKFADLSEHGYGVALLNDCKYGYATHGGTMRLSLLRSPKGPDEHADMGSQNFKYALYPHHGNFSQSDVVRQGYEFNVPLLARTVPESLLETMEPYSAFSVENAPTVIVDTIKKAENADAVILRMYEAYGGHAIAKLMGKNIPAKSVYKTNILEEELEPVEVKDGVAQVKFRPFEIVTLKLNL